MLSSFQLLKFHQECQSRDQVSPYNQANLNEHGMCSVMIQFDHFHLALGYGNVIVRHSCSSKGWLLDNGG